MEECQFLLIIKSFLDGGMSIFFTVIHMGPGTTMTNATPSARPAMFGFVDVFFSISTTSSMTVSIFTTCYTSIIVNGSILYIIISPLVFN